MPRAVTAAVYVVIPDDPALFALINMNRNRIAIYLQLLLETMDEAIRNLLNLATGSTEPSR